MKFLDDYFALQQQIHDYFGYVESWSVIPLCDNRSSFWYLYGDSPKFVCFANSERELEDKTGRYYANLLYTEEHRTQTVFRGDEYTMIVVDTQTDGNKFLQVFSNANERQCSDDDE